MVAMPSERTMRDALQARLAEQGLDVDAARSTVCCHDDGTYHVHMCLLRPDCAATRSAEAHAVAVEAFKAHGVPCASLRVHTYVDHSVRVPESDWFRVQRQGVYDLLGRRRARSPRPRTTTCLEALPWRDREEMRRASPNWCTRRCRPHDCARPRPS